MNVWKLNKRWRQPTDLWPQVRETGHSCCKAVMASRRQQRQGHVRMRGTKQTKRTILIWPNLCFRSVCDNKPSGWQLLTSCFRTFVFRPALLRALPHWLVKNTMASISPHQAALSLKPQGENIRGKNTEFHFLSLIHCEGPTHSFQQENSLRGLLTASLEGVGCSWDQVGEIVTPNHIREEKKLFWFSLLTSQEQLHFWKHPAKTIMGCRSLILQIKIFFLI